MSKSIAHIFGGEAKVKIMRLFIFNPNLIFTAIEVAHRARASSATVRRELNSLIKAGLLKRGARGYTLNRNYSYLSAIGNFLIDAAPLSEKEIVKKLSASGNIKLILISGVFMHLPDARVDILIVGDNIRQGKLLAAMSTIEAELGKEIRYAVFETSDFQYRVGIYDKLVRDILDFQHEKILNKLSLQSMTKTVPTIHSA